MVFDLNCSRKTSDFGYLWCNIMTYGQNYEPHGHIPTPNAFSMLFWMKRWQNHFKTFGNKNKLIFRATSPLNMQTFGWVPYSTRKGGPSQSRLRCIFQSMPTFVCHRWKMFRRRACYTEGNHTGVSQGSHRLSVTKFQDFSRLFQDQICFFKDLDVL